MLLELLPRALLGTCMSILIVTQVTPSHITSGNPGHKSDPISSHSAPSHINIDIHKSTVYAT